MYMIKDQSDFISLSFGSKQEILKETLQTQCFMLILFAIVAIISQKLKTSKCNKITKSLICFGSLCFILISICNQNTKFKADVDCWIFKKKFFLQTLHDSTHTISPSNYLIILTFHHIWENSCIEFNNYGKEVPMYQQLNN